MFFFFQAEDGIRDTSVTGVQTCALPISLRNPADTFDRSRPQAPEASEEDGARRGGSREAVEGVGRIPERHRAIAREPLGRSEERRVGKECRSRWSPYDRKRKRMDRARRR